MAQNRFDDDVENTNQGYTNTNDQGDMSKGGRASQNPNRNDDNQNNSPGIGEMGSDDMDTT